GVRTPLRRRVPPGERVTLEVRIRAPVPPGRYRLALDLVAEHRAWFGEVGAPGPDEELDVLPRVQAEALADVADVHLPPGWELSPGSEQLALAAHAEGYAVVAGSVEAPRRLRRALAPWAGGERAQPPLSGGASRAPAGRGGGGVGGGGGGGGLPPSPPPGDKPLI